MRAVQGNLQGIALKSRFMDVALEYMASHNKRDWIYVPRIISLSDPSDENFLLQATDADERRYHRRNLVINMRDRIPEVIEALQSRPGSVLPDTIQRLGLKGTHYRFGAQVRLEHIPHLEALSGMEHSTFRDIGLHDIPGTMRLRISA